MRKTHILRLFLILSIVGSMLAACGPNWEDIAKQRDDLFAQLGTEEQRMGQASAEVKEWSGKFPLYYTSDNQPQLTAAENALANINGNSSSVGLIKELDEAIEQRDKKIAKERIGQIQEALLSVSAYTELIIGPPGSTGQGFYKSLQEKVNLLNEGLIKGDEKDLLEETKDRDAPTMASIMAAKKNNPFYLCSSTAQMKYIFANSNYGSGLANIKAAEAYYGQNDLPAASDSLVYAIASFNAATGLVASAVDDHQDVVDAIGLANESKMLASAVTWNFFADYYGTASSEYVSGDSDLSSANGKCQVEEFATATYYAVSAKGHFDSAYYWINEEEPDPVVIPSDNSDDDEDTNYYGSEETTTQTEESTDWFGDDNTGSDIYPDYNSGSDIYQDDNSGSDIYTDDDSGGGCCDDSGSGDEYYDDSGSYVPPSLALINLPLWRQDEKTYYIPTNYYLS